MKKDDLIFFQKWFNEYCRSFHSGDIEDQRNIRLKEEHTFNVCRNMTALAGGLSLSKNNTLLAETAALFHDIGRFPQYRKYRTFRDSISVNHGLLGAQTLEETRVLRKLPDEEQELIIRSVKFHNAFSVPKKEKDDVIFFIRLVRDADKLDIWRVFLEYYESPEDQRASAVGLGLPDIPEYTPDVLSQIYKREIISLAKIQTLNDFKLLQLSWIFDLNFLPSFRLLSERDYLNRMISNLPRTEEIKNVFLFLKDFVDQRLSV